MLGVGLKTGSPEVAPGCGMAHTRQSRPDSGLAFEGKVLKPVDRIREGYHESRICSRDSYPESYITKYTSIRR